MGDKSIGWMQVYGGKRLDLKDLGEPGAYDLEGIAHALSMTCRYGGHVKEFYSVAQHSYIISFFGGNPRANLAGLMHDASEAYLTDIPRPLKPFIHGYYDVEEKIMRAIAAQFDFPYPLPREIKDADLRICINEREDFQDIITSTEEYLGMDPAPDPLPINKLSSWEPAKAKEMFLRRYDELALQCAAQKEETCLSESSRLQA